MSFGWNDKQIDLLMKKELVLFISNSKAIKKLYKFLNRAFWASGPENLDSDFYYSFKNGLKFLVPISMPAALQTVLSPNLKLI